MSKAKFGEWIPIEFHTPTKEEKKKTSKRTFLVLDKPIPSDGENVLVCTIYGEMFVYTFRYVDMFDFTKKRIIAWMPLPEPYGGDADDD